ncbi:hypothetical protein Hanom_Chr08g00683091 [Helianthus anomalus]
MNKIKGKLDKMTLDVIYEMNRRVDVCLAAKSNLIYDNKRGFYIDENANPLYFVKIFCAGTYKIEKKEISKNEESENLGSSNSESVCSKCVQ